MKFGRAAGLFLSAVLLAAAGARAGAPPQPGRYKGKGVLETRVDEKLTARQKFELAAILLQNGTLQLFFAEVPELPLWETRQPQGSLDTSGADAVWTGTPNDDATAVTLTGTTSAGTIKLGYDAGTILEPGTTLLAHTFFSFTLKRVGP